MNKMSKYKPHSVDIGPWGKIEQRYVDLIEHEWRVEPMLSLVQFIINNGYDKRLSGYTSLDRLVITIDDPAESHRESLFIQFNQHTRQWHFEYYSKPYDPVEMERYYPEEQGIDKFCQFIEWLKW